MWRVAIVVLAVAACAFHPGTASVDAPDRGSGGSGGGGRDAAADSPTARVILQVNLGGPALSTVAVGGGCNAQATAPGAPFKRTFTAHVTDGVMNVELRAIAPDQAMISAIELRAL